MTLAWDRLTPGAVVVADGVYDVRRRDLGDAALLAGDADRLGAVLVVGGLPHCERGAPDRGRIDVRDDELSRSTCARKRGRDGIQRLRRASHPGEEVAASGAPA